MNKAHTPSTVAPPFGAYSHGIEVPPNARWLYVAGQVGVLPNGKIAEGITAQTEAAINNILAILNSAGMGMEDVTRMNTYLVRPGDLAAVREVRTRMLGSARPASTLVMVAGLASPDWLIEIEAVAAKA